MKKTAAKTTKRKTATKAKAKPTSKAKRATKRTALSAKSVKGLTRKKPAKRAAMKPKGKVVKLRVPDRGGFFPEGEAPFAGATLNAANSTRDQFSGDVADRRTRHIKVPPAHAES